MNSSNSLRFDLIFSYWIFVWFLMYVNDITTYSPKSALIIGTIENIMLLLYMVSDNVNKTKIMHFIAINTIIKILPLLYLRHEKILSKDIYFMIMLFIIYLVWLEINEQHILINMKNIYDSYFDNTKKSPSMKLIDDIKTFF